MKGIPRIKEFPSDNRYWRVDWFGAIQPNPKLPREPVLQIVITPFKTPDISALPPNKLASASSGLVDYTEQQTICIGTGQLPAVCVGSIWRNSECQQQLAGQLTEFKGLEISEHTSQVLNASAKEHNQYIIPYTHYKFGKDGYFSKMVAVEYGGDPYGILIPKAELVRFYYAVSTNLADVIFSGDLKHNLHAVLNMEHTWSEPEEQREVIGLRQRFSDQDGWILSRILNSPEAWSGATAVHDAMLKSRVNGVAAHIESNFPFAGNTNLSARCKMLPTADPNKWRYLVLSLVRCSAAFPFRHLTVYRDNDNNRAKDGEDKPDNEKKPGWGGTRVVPGQQGKPFQSQQAPNKNAATEIFNLPTDRFGDIAGKEPDKPTKEQCEYKSVTVVKPPVDSNQLSSAQGDNTDSTVGTGRLNSTYERAKALPASFDTFIKAIEHLNTYEGFSAKIREPDELTRYIPLTKPEGYRQWSYLDSKSMTPRAVLIGDILYRGCWFSLIEFEHRQTDKCCIGMVFLDSGQHITSVVLAILFTKIAEYRGIWGNIPAIAAENIRIESYKHVWSTPQHLSSIIALKLNNYSEEFQT
ncbi:hypothetical protein AEST_19320 [Alishewanella aestuarii B11]|uniref:TnsE C-terminal domain-containing protein n=1 Tax=Alishewanella aestuarii B11 TaxID=1197174 RepID=J1YBP2_9ALTE|nr:hypothetical protein [Alishewanella aestuarii]EJI85275.1 hypothetical protein AEST_19320 [Alishewanella aestuarii B11]